ncbi:MAG: zinc-ribbon domain-containing protein, partial [Methanomicrobiales archaeon]|nr:zinc-ribbon domain-containing protein [Methanomicrobiales archaeon]
MAFCTSCGKELTPGNKFCEHCGAAVELPAPAPGQAPPVPSAAPAAPGAPIPPLVSPPPVK